MNAGQFTPEVSGRQRGVPWPSLPARVRPAFSIVGRIRPLVLLVPMVLSSCAKTGDPQPPFLRVPRPSLDLSVSQHDDEVVLTVSLPRQNTDGSPAAPPSEIEVFRLTQEDRRAGGEIPESDFLARAERVFYVRDDFSALLRDQKLVFRDPLRGEDRAAVYRRAYRYAVRFINSRNQTAGLGNQALIAPIPVPAPPTGISAEVTQDFVRVRWNPPQEQPDGARSVQVAGYKVYRSEDPKALPSAPLHDGLLERPEWEDRSFQFEKTYYYAVRVIASAENPYAESRLSIPFAVTPVDRFPPPAPVNVQAIVDRGAVLLLWSAPDAPDIAGYRVFQTDSSGGRVTLREGLVSALSFRDEKAEPGARRVYGVSAVDMHGNESPPAEVSIEIPRR